MSKDRIKRVLADGEFFLGFGLGAGIMLIIVGTAHIPVLWPLVGFGLLLIFTNVYHYQR